MTEDAAFDLLPNSTFRYEYDGTDMFVSLDGMRIAKRRLDKRGRATWVQLVPRFWVGTSPDYTQLVIDMEVEGEGTFSCEMATVLGPEDKAWLARHG
jgi:hypothetical protein